MPGDFSMEDADAAWGRMSGEMLPRLRVDPPGWAEDPEKAFHRGDTTDRDILVQSLSDLGYLPSEASSGLGDRSIRSAVAEWRADLPALPVVKLLANTLVTAREFLGPGEMQQLAAQVGFEGELVVGRLPALGERSLLSRIVLFRMKSFALRSEATADVAAPFSLAALQSLAEAGSLLKITPTESASAELNLVHLLGDARGLTDVLMQHWGDWVFVFHHAPSGADESVAGELPSVAEANLAFRSLHGGTSDEYQRLFIATGRHRDDRVPPKEGNRIRNMWGEDGFRYYAAARPLNWIRDEIGKRLPPDLAVGHPVNRMGLELLQLRLWMLGFYRGRVDGEWGPMSYAALREFLAGENVDASRLIRPLAGNRVALNFRYLFKRILPQLEDLSESTGLGDVDALETATLREIDGSGEWAGIQRAYEGMEGEQERLHRADERPRRRYRGLWGILASVGRFLRDVGRSILGAAKALVRAIKRGLGAAMRIFRHFLRGIRRGVRVVGLAVKRFHHWLFNKPFISGEERGVRCVLTRFQHDGDAFHFACEGMDAGELTRHRRGILRMNLAFRIVSRLAIRAVGLIVAGATHNWLKLAWDLVRLLTSRFWRDLKETIRQYRETWTADELAEWLGPSEA